MGSLGACGGEQSQLYSNNRSGINGTRRWLRLVIENGRYPVNKGTDIGQMSHRDSHQLNRQTPVPGKPGGQARKTGAAMVVVAVRH